MTYGEIKVSIQDDYGFSGKKIYIGTITPDGYAVAHSTGEDTYKEGELMVPSLSLNEMQFRALVDAIHKDYKPSEGKFTEGKLEATERHLTDLRQLLKLK